MNIFWHTVCHIQYIYPYLWSHIDKINITSDRDSFQSHTFSVDNVEIDRNNLKWFHYVVCGLRARIQDHRKFYGHIFCIGLVKPVKSGWRTFWAEKINWLGLARYGKYSYGIGIIVKFRIKFETVIFDHFPPSHEESNEIKIDF